jgi:2-polyprenyl-6-hydroxyphenyl methylase/3-demethylubiquinone-9 3-methyltransferase
MKEKSAISGYQYQDAETNHAHSYLLPVLKSELRALMATMPESRRKLFDLGCGNGSVAAVLASEGWSVTGVDPSTDGIAAAKAAYPELHLEVGSAYEDLVSRFGRFPVVISLEVVEHVYAPREFARTLFDLGEPGGTMIASTPYHGYLKNLALAVSGKMDTHFTALWDHGHIKFWSIPTLRILLEEAGFREIRFHRVGRIPHFAKSIIAVARKPML